MTVTITEPGLYDLAEDVYHSDCVPGGSLSASTAKKLVLPSCPAIADYQRKHPVTKAAYDFGHAAHKMVLGIGAEVVVIPGQRWDTKEAKQAVADARAAGRIPMKSSDLAAAVRMSEAVKRHALAGPLFRAGTGIAEQSIFWQDQRTGTWCRSMLDWLSLLPGQRPLVVDLKTCTDVSPAGIAKAVANFQYHQQDQFYRHAVASLGYDDPAFLFVFVTKDPPHLVQVVELDERSLEEGRALNRDAIDIWIRCRETGVWPGYENENDIQLMGLPKWAYRRDQELYA